MCVAWIRHQRGSRPTLSSNHATGVAFQHREAIRDFPGLLGGMDMDRPVAMRRNRLLEHIRRHGAQRMRRDADARAGQRLHDVLAAHAAPRSDPGR